MLESVNQQNIILSPKIFRQTNIRERKMIYSIGEILLDVFSEEKENSLAMSGKIGGAPFNVAANVALNGGDVFFIGAIGNDAFGKYIEKQSKKYPINKIILDKTNSNTTIALVSLNNGERSFSFLRGADYQISSKTIERLPFKPGDIVHIGSLMLSEEKGRETFDSIVSFVKKKGAYISFDANLRLDTFKNEKEAMRVFVKTFKSIDFLKLSEDELNFFGYESPESFYPTLKKGCYLFVTYGAKGSSVTYKGETTFVPSTPVSVVDSTGAGDAFYGRILMEIASSSNIKFADWKEILSKANEDGAKTTTHYGAIL